MALPAAQTFGELLKYLRRRARITQRELAIAVGYTEAHISRLESNERTPDLATVAALFVPALYLEDDPELIERLLKLAALARHEQHFSKVTINQITVEHHMEQELGALEDLPGLLPHTIERPALERRLHAALEKEHSVVLSGLPGVGKTVLAASAARQCAPRPVFWITLTGGVNTAAEAVARQVALFLLALGQTQVRPIVEHRTDSAPMPLDQQLLLLRAALVKQPALLCLDDVHLLLDNEKSLALLRHLMTTTPAWFLLTSRQDVPLPALHIKLSGLERSEGLELVECLGLKLEPGLAERLLARTGGSPMLIKLSAGQILEQESEPRAFIEHIETQPQVAGYLLNTIMRDLSPAAQWMASLVAVFRRPVNMYDEVLNELLEKTGQPWNSNAALDELQCHHLVEDAHRASLHPLVRDHLQATLGANPSLNRQLHRLAAEWSEQSAGDLVEAAYHWIHAGDVEQAIEVIGDKSELLQNRGQSQAAVDVVDEAFERLRHRRGDTSSLRMQLYTARGDFLTGKVRAAEAEASYREALALAHGIPTVRAQIVRKLAHLLMQRSQPAEAMTLCQSALAELLPGDIVLASRLTVALARAHLMQSHYVEAEKAASEALTLANQFTELLPDVANDVRARAERTLGWISYTRHPQGMESLGHYRKALDYARRAGLRSIENSALSNLATALSEQGNLDSAQQFYQEALQGFEMLGDLYGTAGVLHNLGLVAHERGDYEAGLRFAERASELEWQIGDLEGALITDAARASMMLSMNRSAEARQVLERALAGNQGSSDTWTLGSCLCTLSEVQLVQGELKAARLTNQRVLAIPGLQHNARMLAWAQSGSALLHICSGESAAALELVAAEPAGDLGAELTCRWWMVQCAALLANDGLQAAQHKARWLIAEARQRGYRRPLKAIERFLEQPGLSATELARLIVTS